MNIPALLVNFKCENKCFFYDKRVREEYMIDTCVNNEDRIKKIKENSLLIDLLESSSVLNYNNEYGEKVIECDFKKIKELQ